MDQETPLLSPARASTLFISFILGVANQSDVLLYVMTEKNLSNAGTVSSRVYTMRSSPE